MVARPPPAMADAKSIVVTVIDMGTGRSAEVEVGADASTEGASAKAYVDMGEARRKSDRYFDDRGRSLDGSLDKPVSTLVRGQDGAATVEIRHPTGGGNVRRLFGGVGH